MSQVWTKLERPEGVPWPMERVWHAACCLNYGDDYPQLLITGGLDKNLNTLSDAWLLDLTSGRWREVREVEGSEAGGGCVCVTKPRSGSIILYCPYIRIEPQVTVSSETDCMLPN